MCPKAHRMFRRSLAVSTPVTDPDRPHCGEPGAQVVAKHLVEVGAVGSHPGSGFRIGSAHRIGLEVHAANHRLRLRVVEHRPGEVQVALMMIAVSLKIDPVLFERVAPLRPAVGKKADSRVDVLDGR